jgi:hypothetical protein
LGSWILGHGQGVYEQRSSLAQKQQSCVPSAD